MKTLFSVFLVSAALLVLLISHTTDALSAKISCPLSLPEIFCLIPPCTELSNDKCIGDSKATCRADECTPCNRHFVGSDGKRIPAVKCE